MRWNNACKFEAELIGQQYIMINYTMKKSEDNEVEKKSTLAKLLATENIEVQENSASTASFDVKNTNVHQGILF